MASAPAFQTVAEAVQAQRVECALEMLEAGYDVDAQEMNGNTALHWAAWFKLDGMVTRLLECKARVDVGNSAGETAVHWAAKSLNVKALGCMTRGDHELLSQRDKDGFTPLLILAQNDHSPVMEWMYLKGISVEEQDDWGRTALQWACYKGHRRTVQWLLSRSANLAHRDHEGMTAIHWAALKGHKQVAETLIYVGAVHLLNVPDSAGDTPIRLAHRKKNRYMVVHFVKCQLLYHLIGRPYLSRNHFANLFVGLMILNVCVFVFIIAPGIIAMHPGTVVTWSLLVVGTMALWVWACFADPGWVAPRTVLPQDECRGDREDLAGGRGFDALQPVESQMAYADDRADAAFDGTGESELVRMELDQNKYNYQRQLISKARHRLEENDACCGVPTYDSAFTSSGPPAGSGTAELQPLVDAQQQSSQLDRASVELRQRARVTGESLGRRRQLALPGEGRHQYVELLEKEDFKEVCVVCRTVREMRSHHCKECGRCVRRLDHHCPWIDNCVGLGNQRSFYCFIVSLLVTIASYYRVFAYYVADVVFPALSWSGVGQALASASRSWSLGPQLRPMLVLLTAAFDVIWLVFVGMLVVRHTAYMCVNVTTYEVLVRPPHMQRRFPRSGQGRAWYVRGATLGRALRACLGYWTLSMEHDALDFAPPGGFVATFGDKVSTTGARGS